MGEEDNFWTSGVTGPCRPCSEIYFDFHPERELFDTDLGDDSRFIQFYDLVFMQYNRTYDGSLELLKQMNIDTGLGLECMALILQKVPNNYETDLIFPIIEKTSELANVPYALAADPVKTNLKIMGEHIVFLLSDGVHHRATHLLQAALKVIGKETSQAGSLVAFDRLRFDFNFHRPLSDNELMEIEDTINSWIANATLLQTKVMSLAYAKSAEAISMFGEKYGEQVIVSLTMLVTVVLYLHKIGIITSMGRGTRPADGTRATTCTPAPLQMKLMLRSTDELPLNFGFIGKFH